MPKRYCVFTGHNYYPEGGMRDFHSSYDSIEEASAVTTALNKNPQHWAEMFDMEEY